MAGDFEYEPRRVRPSEPLNYWYLSLAIAVGIVMGALTVEAINFIVVRALVISAVENMKPPVPPMPFKH